MYLGAKNMIQWRNLRLFIRPKLYNFDLLLKTKAMLDLSQQIPDYLTNKKNIIRLILFTAAFALVFINIYAPFESRHWLEKPITDWQYLFYSSLVILTGVLVVVISRIIMYQMAKLQPLLVWHYLLWVLAEIIFMALFFTLFEKLVLKDDAFFMDLLKTAAKHTALVLLLPYAMLWLYFSWVEKQQQLQTIAEQGVIPDNSRNMIPFYDERGGLKFSIKMGCLLYIESADNYVNIFYLDNNKILRYTLRSTIKRMEEFFKGTETIRCHRSFMVNFERVKMLRKKQHELTLELDAPSLVEIPVSKTYVQNVMNTFTKFSM